MFTFSTLDAWFTYLESSHPVSIAMELTRIDKIKDALKLSFTCPIITVGGTNGKGSTCVILESILLEAGYTVGCYTSPHLLLFNERVRINGENATDVQLLPHFEAVEIARCSFPKPVLLTYFEFTTLAVMHLFSLYKFNAVIFEVGMGGRCDAVNILDTGCAIITNVDFDHVEYLGETRDQIALEKAGILRTDTPAICADFSPPKTLIDYAQQIGADLWLLGRDFRYERQAGYECQQWIYTGRTLRCAPLVYPALRGKNQLINTSAALAGLEALRDCLPVSVQDINLGLANVELPGRFQVLSGKPLIIYDVAHNPLAAEVLAQNLESIGYFAYTYAVFGVMRDKDIVGIAQHLKGYIDHWCVTNLALPRAASAQALEKVLYEIGISNYLGRGITCHESPALAFQDALKYASENDRILVFGSFVTVADVMIWQNNSKN